MRVCVCVCVCHRVTHVTFTHTSDSMAMKVNDDKTEGKNYVSLKFVCVCGWGCVHMCVSVYVCGWGVIVNFLSCESFGSLPLPLCV